MHVFQLIGDDAATVLGHDGAGATGRDNSDRGGTPTRPTKDGERIVQAFLSTGAPSLNELERLHSSESWFRDALFKQTYDSVSRKALDVAQNATLSMSFFKLAEAKFKNPDAAERLYRTYSPEESFDWVQKILVFNDIDEERFFDDVFLCMDRIRPKLNSLFFMGPPNAGKTLVAESIARCAVFYCNIQSFAKGKGFLFQDAVGKRCCMINEPRITDEHAEVLKNILEGCPTHVDVKYKSGQMLNRTPVVITSNLDLGVYLLTGKETQQRAFDKRCVKYHFKTMEALRECKYALHPGLWYLAAKRLTELNVMYQDCPDSVEDFL